MTTIMPTTGSPVGGEMMQESGYPIELGIGEKTLDELHSMTLDDSTVPEMISIETYLNS